MEIVLHECKRGIGLSYIKWAKLVDKYLYKQWPTPSKVRKNGTLRNNLRLVPAPGSVHEARPLRINFRVNVRARLHKVHKPNPNVYPKAPSHWL